MYLIGPTGNKNHQTPTNIVKKPSIKIIHFGINDILDKIKQMGPENNTIKNISPAINAKLAISFPHHLPKVHHLWEPTFHPDHIRNHHLHVPHPQPT